MVFSLHAGRVCFASLVLALNYSFRSYSSRRAADRVVRHRLPRTLAVVHILVRAQSRYYKLVGSPGTLAVLVSPSENLGARGRCPWPGTARLSTMFQPPLPHMRRRPPLWRHDIDQAGRCTWWTHDTARVPSVHALISALPFVHQGNQVPGIWRRRSFIGSPYQLGLVAHSRRACTKDKNTLC